MCLGVLVNTTEALPSELHTMAFKGLSIETSVLLYCLATDALYDHRTFQYCVIHVFKKQYHAGPYITVKFSWHLEI